MESLLYNQTGINLNLLPRHTRVLCGSNKRISAVFQTRFLFQGRSLLDHLLSFRRVFQTPLGHQQARQNSVDADLRPLRNRETFHQMQAGCLCDRVRHAASAGSGTGH